MCLNRHSFHALSVCIYECLCALQMEKSIYPWYQFQVKRLTSTVESLQKSCSDFEGKAEDYLKKLKEGREEQATLEEQLRKELSQQVC